jgi:hypothetical protein
MTTSQCGADLRPRFAATIGKRQQEVRDPPSIHRLLIQTSKRSLMCFAI